MSQMKIQLYIDQKKKLNNLLLNFLENSDEISHDFQDLTKFFKEIQLGSNSDELKFILKLISKVSNNHIRQANFIDKIEQVLLFMKDHLLKQISNLDILTIFKNNRRILLFLLKKEIVKLDKSNIYLIYDHCHFFYPEIQSIIDDKFLKSIEKEILKLDSDKFESNRQLGENESIICSLIRDDSVIDFITHVNRLSIPLSSEIKHSIFETNKFLIKRENTSLIEYAAFYGSIEIFQYLLLNNVEFKSSLWLYSIHGRNAEIIHLLEENHVELPNNSFYKLIKEAIKCHHNDFADYFINLNNQKSDIFDIIIEYSFKYNNYYYFNYDLTKCFFLLCKYKYTELITFFIAKNKNDMIKYIRKISSFSIE